MKFYSESIIEPNILLMRDICNVKILWMIVKYNSEEVKRKR